MKIMLRSPKKMQIVNGFGTSSCRWSQYCTGNAAKYISPINEPQWKWGGASVWQEGCHYECEEVLEVFHLFAV